jgi:hypothetical protein
MKLSIIPSDSAVYIDEICYHDIDMSWIPEIDGKIVHAVQWLDNKGEIEFVGPHQNMKIDTLVLHGICNFEQAIELWNEKKTEEDAFRKKILEEEEQRRKEEEERVQSQFLETHIPASEEEDEDEDLFYDIEELLKEI